MKCIAWHTAVAFLIVVPADGFGVHPFSIRLAPQRQHSRRTPCNTLSAKASEDSKHDGAVGGYKFGDLSRSLLKKAANKVNDVTGKDAYEFGDLSRWLDGRAKDRVQAIRGDTTGAQSYTYQVGDFTRWADALAKEQAAHYAGKESASDYKVGDITRTVVRKVRSGEYQMDDVYLAMRVLLTAGFSVLPIAGLLPVKGLIGLVELGLTKDIGGRLMEVLISTLDSRCKEALTGNADYKLGDTAKARLQQALAKFTGKDSYEFGDVARAIQTRQTAKSSGRSTAEDLHSIAKELSDWDARYLEHESKATPNPETMTDSELKAWDKKLQAKVGEANTGSSGQAS